LLLDVAYLCIALVSSRQERVIIPKRRIDNLHAVVQRAPKKGEVEEVSDCIEEEKDWQYHTRFYWLLFYYYCWQVLKRSMHGRW
jgi:hypothetical protein